MPQLSENLRPERFNRRRRRSNRRFFRRLRRSVPSSGGSVLRGAQQSSTHQVQVGQRAGHDQSIPVLVQPSVACLGEAEDALDDEEGMLDPGRACQKFCV
jgi:hypothetical protein